MSINESIVDYAALEWFALRRGCGGQVRGAGTGYEDGLGLLVLSMVFER